MLTFQQASSYLQKEALIDSRSLVLGGFSIHDTSRRNHNLQVVCSDGGPSYLIKEGVGPDRQETIRREAQVYAFLWAERRGWNFTAFLPKFYRYDAEGHLLIVELVKDAHTLREYNLQRKRFSPRLAALVGKALAKLHRLPSREPYVDGAGDLSSRVPWILSVHLPGLNLFQDFSQGSIQLIKIVQGQADFCNRLDVLRSRWRIETFVHNDMKWDNCLVYPKPSSTHISQMKIIDWELAGYGDPAWDVGSFFSEYLSSWLLSIPIAAGMDPDQLIALAQLPLEMMQPAIQAFWNSYLRHSQVEGEHAAQMLDKATQFGAARLIQTAMEQAQMTPELTGSTLLMLQLSLNMLTRPEQAMIYLLGISRNGS